MKFTHVFTNEKNQDFIDLYRELWNEYFEKVGEGLNKYQEVNNLGGKHFVVLIFDKDNDINKPIACGSFKEFSNYIVEIKRVFVKKQYRNMGLATLIMEKLEKEAKMRNYNLSILVTGKNNLPSQSLYKKLDYHKCEGFGIFKGDIDAISFKKKL